MDDHNDAEVARISELLKTAIRMAGVSNREIERRLGLSGGYLSRLFSGGIELKVKHILDISEVIDLDAGEFFQIVFPPHKDIRSPTARKLLDLVSRIQGVETAPAPQLQPQVDQRQIEEMIRGAIRKVFAELGR
jgi:transcriptional regulator with XRE-family HTH domain